MKPTELSDDIDSKLILQGVHVELTDAMRSVMREKFGRILTRNQEALRLNIRLHQDQTMGTEHHYTLTAQLEIGGPDLIASVGGKEAYDLVDEAVEKLNHLLERRQGRRRDKRNHPHEVEVGGQIPKAGEIARG